MWGGKGENGHTERFDNGRESVEWDERDWVIGGSHHQVHDARKPCDPAPHPCVCSRNNLGGANG
jgi:hypothetical protein